jgi:hypothetical protein
MLTGVYFMHRQLRIKTVPYEKIEDDQKVLMTLTDEERQRWTQLESLLQHELADQVIANRKEKFDNPAILLGLKKDYDSI